MQMFVSRRNFTATAGVAAAEVAGGQPPSRTPAAAQRQRLSYRRRAAPVASAAGARGGVAGLPAGAVRARAAALLADVTRGERARDARVVAARRLGGARAAHRA